MSRDWLAYFKAKRGMGAVICEGPEIEAACAEIEALLTRHNALVEAVKKMFATNCNDYWDAMEYQSARAEVDRLIANGSAADCKGEG